MQSSYALGLAVLTMATAPKILDALSGDVDTEFGAAFAAYLSGFISNWLFTLVLWHHYWYIEQKLKATSLKHVPLNGYCCKDIKRKDRNECEKCGEEKHAGTACTSEVSSSSEYNKREEREHDETTCGSEAVPVESQPDVQASGRESPDLRRKRWDTPHSNRAFELRVRFMKEKKKKMEAMQNASRETQNGNGHPPF
ncbi:unnamed protein product [Litomosoides sigmodontis]|uniref:Uncharacterized protein n=1 Tax=Litomosoides sigmodontis TaxID=42156 RepID=A0A3P6U321_LITSI|nr:unnamed protein product [Litomosoides sigmodontis]VDK89293.1 unnamed protein product [Litomosoides sigmodontis]